MNYAVNLRTKAHRVLPKWHPPLPDETVVTADEKGFINHGTNECPLPDDVFCEVKLISDSPSSGGAKPALLWVWKKQGLGSDIVAYRPVIDIKPQAPKNCVTVRYDLDPVNVEGAIRDKLIEMGWTPPQDGLSEWNGEGVPSTGCKVSYPSGRGIVRLPPDAYKVVIVEDDEGGYKRIDVRALEPIRTDREKWVAEAYKHVSDDLLASMEWSRHSEMVIEDIYKALKSGDLPMPKTDNRH